MASAAASRPPASPPPPPPPPPAQAALQWLGPRVSFSLDDAGGGGGGGGGREASASGKPGASSGADFEFLLAAGCSAVSMLPADELFSGGKLVPLRIPAPLLPPSASVEEAVVTAVMPTKQQQPGETPRGDDVAKSVAAPGEAVAAAEPKIPARRWRDLLRMRKQQHHQASSSSSSGPSDPRPFRRLLRRGPKPADPEPSLSLPLLPRESSGGPDEPPAAEKTGPPPPLPTAAAAPASASLPPSQQHHNQSLPPKIRLPPTTPTSAPPPPPPPPPPPAVTVAADSPRLNAAGKVVFNGLGRSSSSPSSLAGGRRNHHHHRGGGGAIERSYSAHVRVAPVLNVPVCSLRGSRKSVSVFGIDRLFSPSSSSSSSASSFAAAAAAGKKAKAAAKKDATVPAAAVQ